MLTLKLAVKKVNPVVWYLHLKLPPQWAISLVNRQPKHIRSYTGFTKRSITEWKPDPLFRTKWKNTGRVRRESKGERFRNSRGSNGSFIRSWSRRAGRNESPVCAGPNRPGQARHPARERALRPGGAFTPSTRPSGVIPPSCLSIPLHLMSFSTGTVSRGPAR